MTKVDISFLGKRSRLSYFLYIITSSIGNLFRLFAYKHVYFFDTNFLISKEKKLDKRLIKIKHVSKNLYTTGYIRKEVDEKLEEGNFIKIFNSDLTIISFNDLYRQDSRICPTYYSFIGAMHNPANITSPEFELQMLFSKIIKKENFSKEETKLHILMMNKLINQVESKVNQGGELKSELENVMGEAHLRSIKKRKDGLKGKNKNYGNDLRNLATIFMYSILNKENVTFITADSDAIALFFDWSASIIQKCVFNTRCLTELSKNENEGMEKLCNGEKQYIYFDGDEISKYLAATLIRFYSDRTKYFSPRLTIKYWDKKRQKFYKIGVNIDQYIRELFFYCHNSLNCPTAKNDLMGCFIRYKYWWPPSLEDNNKLKIEAGLKEMYKESESIPPHIHDKACLYRRSDLNNNFDIFSTFTKE